MLILDADDTRNALAWRPLIEALRQLFISGCEMPLRHHHDMAVPDEPDGTLLLMPAWLPGRYIGVKLVNVMPGNNARGLPAVAANYCLSHGRTGAMLALIDGGELTVRRTAAASALAADYLARGDARRLLVLGTGRLAPNLVAAHAAVRPIQQVMVWGRSLAKATALAERLEGEMDLSAAPVTDLPRAAGEADIVTAATLAVEPILDGQWLKGGCHVDLVGAFRPHMREANDALIRRARVFVDTRPGASVEAGDIAIPLASGVLTPEAIQGDLFELTRGQCSGRQTPGEITCFKSVGAALEDLAGAMLAYESHRQTTAPGTTPPP